MIIGAHNIHSYASTAALTREVCKADTHSALMIYVMRMRRADRFCSQKHYSFLLDQGAATAEGLMHIYGNIKRGQPVTSRLIRNFLFQFVCRQNNNIAKSWEIICEVLSNTAIITIHNDSRLKEEHPSGDVHSRTFVHLQLVRCVSDDRKPAAELSHAVLLTVSKHQQAAEGL